MLIGDRGHCIGSRIKGHNRYGGKWKEIIQAQNTYVCVTNEHMTSQICVFCYNPLHHPKYEKLIKGKTIYVDVKGSFVCMNPSCVTVRSGCAVKSRDTLSALAIGISGFSQLLYGDTLPEYSPRIGTSKTNYINITATFGKQSDVLGSEH